MIPDFQFLVSDYMRPGETLTLLLSIADKVKIPRDRYWVTLLDNGGTNSDVYTDAYEGGLIDQLVVRKTNTGGSWAMRDLAYLCQSEYAFLLQSDQFLKEEITETTIEYFKGLLNSGYKCVDLAGCQCGEQNKYSDRAQFVWVDNYQQWVRGCKNFGPGPTQGDGPHNEELIQVRFKAGDWKIAHVSPLFFADNGKWSIRQHPDGSITKHATDEKTLFIIKQPTKKIESMGIDDESWELILSGKWQDGSIPNSWKKDSFYCFKR